LRRGAHDTVPPGPPTAPGNLRGTWTVLEAELGQRAVEEGDLLAEGVHTRPSGSAAPLAQVRRTEALFRSPSHPSAASTTPKGSGTKAAPEALLSSTASLGSSGS
jgi:hypothetical protein